MTHGTADQEAWMKTISAEDTAFFLDVDGTLLGFKDRPEDVVADDALLALLRRLREDADGALALVSGRMVEDLDRIVAPLVLPAGGVHGADLRFADGRREIAEGAAIAEVRDATRRFVEDRPGLRLEDKGATLAVHYRHAPERAEEVATFLGKTIAGHDLMVQHGKMVAEVKSTGCHKGMAIERLLRTSPFVGRAPMFIGDDLTDEHGFETVNRLGGISVKVGPENEPTAAVHRVADVTAVHNLLDGICRTSEQTK